MVAHGVFSKTLEDIVLPRSEALDPGLHLRNSDGTRITE